MPIISTTRTTLRVGEWVCRRCARVTGARSNACEGCGGARDARSLVIGRWRCTSCDSDNNPVRGTCWCCGTANERALAPAAVTSEAPTAGLVGPLASSSSSSLPFARAAGTPGRNASRPGASSQPESWTAQGVRVDVAAVQTCALWRCRCGYRNSHACMRCRGCKAHRSFTHPGRR